MEQVVTNWTKQDGHWVAWSGSTRIMHGPVEYKGEQYYIRDGFMVENRFVERDGQTYHYGHDGKMQFRWQKIHGDWYYFYHDDGTMVKDAFVIGREGQVYYIGENGVMLENKDARFNENGELKVDGKRVGSMIYDDALADN